MKIPSLTKNIRTNYHIALIETFPTDIFITKEKNWKFEIVRIKEKMDKLQTVRRIYKD